MGAVTASFSENQVAFFVDKTGGGELTFFIIDSDTYGYASDAYKGRIEVGRLISGEDVRFIARRILICASEDVGNADPQALVVA